MNPTAVVGRRVAAFLIDGLLVGAITAIAWFALTKKIGGACIGGGVEINGDCRGFTSDASGNRTLWIIISLAASLTVYWFMPSLKGFSPGKAAMGIRVIGRDGGPPGLGRGLVRYLMWIFDSFPWVIPYLTGFICALTDAQEHRRLGDRVAGTLVVDRNAAGRPVPAGGAPGQFGAPPQYGGAPQYGSAPPQPPQPAVPVGGGQPAGWYDDPQRQARLRWWDGSSWTSHTSG
jgi:uncharacterized RDD family membrane protein YckC